MSVVGRIGSGEGGLDRFLHRRVILDTPGSMVYIGVLESYDDRGYWLRDADVHDRSEGHSTKEEYISRSFELERTGTRRFNRRRVFVERSFVISISALEDVVLQDETTDEAGDLLP